MRYLSSVIIIVSFLLLSSPVSALPEDENSYVHEISTIAIAMSEAIIGFSQADSNGEKEAASLLVAEEFEVFKEQINELGIPEDKEGYWNVVHYALINTCDECIFEYGRYSEGYRLNIENAADYLEAALILIQGMI